MAEWWNRSLIVSLIVKYTWKLTGDLTDWRKTKNRTSRIGGTRLCCLMKPRLNFLAFVAVLC